MARTVPTLNSTLGRGFAHGFKGMPELFEFSVTNDPSTTVAIPLDGGIPWEITNQSGASATLTFSNALTANGTSLTKYDDISAAVPAITISNNCSHSLPVALAGCTFLVITGAVAASGFTLKVMR